MTADSHNGYVCEFECYTGHKDGTAEKGLGGSVVTQLTRDLVGKSYQIFMDNLFHLYLCIVHYYSIVFIVLVQLEVAGATSLLT